MKNKILSEYDWSAKYYDELCNSDVVKDDVEFYKPHIKSAHSVLELGCGTGRVGIELCSICRTYTGIDLSSSMLSVYEKKIKAAEVTNTNLIATSMCSFKLNEQYDLIIFPFRSFQALTTESERKACLSLCIEHLKKEGRIIIQMFDPNFNLLDTFGSLHNLDKSFHDGELKIERYTLGRGHDRETQTISLSYIFKTYRDNECIDIIDERLRLGYMDLTQATTLFENCGLVVENVFKWWDRSPIDHDKKELIFELKSA